MVHAPTWHASPPVSEISTPAKISLIIGTLMFGGDPCGVVLTGPPYKPSSSPLDIRQCIMWQSSNAPSPFALHVSPLRVLLNGPSSFQCALESLAVPLNPTVSKPSIVKPLLTVDATVPESPASTYTD